MDPKTQPAQGPRTEEQIVQEMFWAYLGRPADDGAVGYYADMLRSGVDPQKIEREVAESPESIERARLGIRRPGVKRVWPLATDLVKRRRRAPEQPERLDDIEEILARLDWRQAALIEEAQSFFDEMQSVRRSLDVLSKEFADEGRRREHEKNLFHVLAADLNAKLDSLLARQVVSCGETTVVRWKDWLFGLPSSEWVLASGVAMHGHPARGLVEFLRSTLSPGMSYVEVGAGFGLSFLPAASAVMPGGSAEAWEPDAASRDCIDRNLLLNRFEPECRILTRPEAAGALDGSASLKIDRLTRGRSSLFLPDAQAGLETAVSVRRLDSACQERIDLLRLDAEGSEWEILEGASGLLAGRMIGIIAINFAPSALSRAGRSPAQFLDMLERLDGKLNFIHEDTGTLTPYQRDSALQGVPVNLALSFV